MGLLSNTSGRKKVINGIMNHGSKISLLLFISGFVWLGLLAHQDFNAKNYFSENQLLPGMVETYFSDSHHVYKTLRMLQRKCNPSDNKIIRQEVVSEFEKLDFDVFTQSFSLQSQNISGTNVYGIYRSPRASGVESIVLNVPYHGGCNSLSSISVMLALGKYFRKQTFWAKDIIFLVTEHSVFGMSAWLEGYFQDRGSDLVFDDLQGHGGSMQAALVLDLPSESISHLDISIQGLNGMLPNLDLVHVIARIANLERVPVKLEKQGQLYTRPSDYQNSLETLLKTMAGQATGIPSGNHGLFYKYRIEAYTLKGMQTAPGNLAIDFESLGRLVEGVFRSMNNLLEHIHQSFFMYLLPNNNRYISIGLYMPPLGCLVAPLLVHFLQCWISIFQLDQPTTQQSPHVETVSLLIVLDKFVISQYMLSYVFSGLLLLCFVYKQYWLSHADELQKFIAYNVCCFVAAVSIRIVYRSNGNKVHCLYRTLHLAAFIVMASIVNFSAAFYIAALYVPLLVCSDTARMLKKLLYVVLLFITCPPTFLYILCCLSNISLIDKDFKIEEILSKTLLTWDSTVSLIERYHSIRLWTGGSVFLFLLPLWISGASEL